MNRTVWCVLGILGLGASGAGPAGGRGRLEGRRQGARFLADGDRRQDVFARPVQGKEGRRHRLVPQGRHPRLHRRVQVVSREQRQPQAPERRLLHRERRSRAANKTFSTKLGLDYPILSDPDKTVARPTASSTANAKSPSAGRSTSTRTARSRRSTRRSTPSRPAPTSPRRSRSWDWPASERGPGVRGNPGMPSACCGRAIWPIAG